MRIRIADFFLEKCNHAGQSAAGFKPGSFPTHKGRACLAEWGSTASCGVPSAEAVLSGLARSPAAPPPTAPATAPIAPPTSMPSGPATTAPTAAPAAEPATRPPPIRTDFDSRSASSGLSATCAAESGSWDGTPWPGTACSARSGSTACVPDRWVVDEFMCTPLRS